MKRIPLTRRRLILMGVVLAFVLALAFLLRDFVRQSILQPLIDLGWFIWVELQTVPQIVFWALYLLIALVIALRSLQGSAGRTLVGYVTRVVPHTPHFSRYHHWKVNLDALSGSPFARERLERELQNLILQVLADRARVDFEEIRERQKHGNLDLSSEPQAVSALFETDHQKYFTVQSVTLPSWLLRLLHRPVPAQNPNYGALDTLWIIQWMEEQTGSGGLESAMKAEQSR